MKKLLCIILCVSMLASLGMGCAKSEGNTTQGTEVPAPSLKVGYARVDITPTGSLLMSGGLTDRLSTGVTDPICATCIAFTDGTGKTILLFSMDLTRSYDNVTPWSRLDISKATGIPANQIMFSATHMHRGPKVQQENNEDIANYIKTVLRPKLLEAAKEAISDQKDAKVLTANTTMEGMNFIRHYLMDDGSVVGDNFGSTKGKQYVKHMDETDKQLQLIRFTREGAEDVIMVNWQGHPHRSGGGSQTTYSSDLVGVMRDEMEKQLNCKFAYFTGASGDINSHSRIQSENITKDYIEQGKKMAEIAINALKTAEAEELANMQIIQRKHTAKPKTEGTAVLDFEMNAMTLGDIGFIFAPYEMFNDNGLFIKEKSPFDTTFIITYANQHLFYIPSAHAYEYNAEYEISVSRYAPGTAEDLANKYVEMLNELYPTRK